MVEVTQTQQKVSTASKMLTQRGDLASGAKEAVINSTFFWMRSSLFFYRRGWRGKPNCLLPSPTATSFPSPTPATLGPPASELQGGPSKHGEKGWVLGN